LSKGGISPVASWKGPSEFRCCSDGAAEIVSKKYMKTSCLASLGGKQSASGQKGDLEAELKWFIL